MHSSMNTNKMAKKMSWLRKKTNLTKQLVVEWRQHEQLPLLALLLKFKDEVANPMIRLVTMRIEIMHATNQSKTRNSLSLQKIPLERLNCNQVLQFDTYHKYRL